MKLERLSFGASVHKAIMGLEYWNVETTLTPGDLDAERPFRSALLAEFALRVPPVPPMPKLADLLRVVAFPVSTLNCA